jgi:DNA-binding transcriptional regulator LsrR (DeoR family)
MLASITTTELLMQRTGDLMAGRPLSNSALASMHMVLAAQGFYLEGRSKSAIADELGISRFKVARLLTEAIHRKVVTFQINPPSDIDFEQSVRLSKTYGLRQAVVLRLIEGAAGPRRTQLGQACAPVLGELLEDGDVLGVSWGRTLQAMVSALTELPRCSVVQIVGTVPTSDQRVTSQDLVRDISDRSGGEVFGLHVPMVVDSASTATRLRSDPHVQRTISTYGSITKAVVGIGAWSPPQSSLREALPQELREVLQQAGACADICATVLDSAGREILAGDLPGRSVAITAEQLRAIPDVIAIVAGGDRTAAIHAALRSGIIHRLITDDHTATALLQHTA